MIVLLLLSPTLSLRKCGGEINDMIEVQAWQNLVPTELENGRTGGNHAESVLNPGLECYIICHIASYNPAFAKSRIAF